MSNTDQNPEKPTDQWQQTGRGAGAESRESDESLADRVEREGIVDQQAVVLDDIESQGDSA